ncbi:unnamed protein product [Adineta ricciae]|uniref:Uncharacterized protein n=1 Tax=Adineta ricciae TaxID=249248 RepID=A0A815KWY9_ADIRI|nr:unnamed protein product [Adineta ricciae]
MCSKETWNVNVDRLARSNCVYRENIRKSLIYPTADSSDERCSLRSVSLIELNSNIDQSSEDYLNFKTQLRWTNSTLVPFTTVDECINFLTNYKNERIFIILSNTLGKTIVPRIHDLHQLDSIVIFDNSQTLNDEWMKNWRKMRGTHSQLTSICNLLASIVQQHSQNVVPISLASADIGSKTSLDELDHTFMYTQLLKESLLDIDHDKTECVHTFADYWRHQCPYNTPEIDKFEKEYPLHSPTWWYSNTVFLFECVNQALRTLDVDIILKIAFFMCHLHRNIQQIHSEQSSKHGKSFTVYRGYGLPVVDFEKLRKAKGGLLSFNNFLSTSKDEKVASMFAESNTNGTDLIGIHFKITVNGRNSSVPYAFLRGGLSSHPNEKEVLFSMHTVFRIGEIEQIGDNNRLWRVNLTATHDRDPQLSALTDRLEEETQRGSKGWSRLGKVLLKLGEAREADKLYELLLNEESNETEKSYFYSQLGYCKVDQGKAGEAVKFYKKAVEIGEKNLHPYDHVLAIYYNNLASAYGKISEHSKALTLYSKAQEIYEKKPDDKNELLAMTYSNMAFTYDCMGQYERALFFYKKHLDISKHILPSNHPDLATTYSNVCLVYNNLGKHAKALDSVEKALEIQEKILPSNHPDLATSYNNKGLVYVSSKNYSKALPFYQKALTIREKINPPNYSDLAQSYNNMGDYYHQHEKDYPKALSFYEETLKIRQNADLQNPHDLYICYNNIGLVHTDMNKHSDALSLFKEAEKFLEKAVRKDHPDYAILYNNIGGTLTRIGDYRAALSYCNKVLEIRKNLLPANDPKLLIWYYRIAMLWYKLTNQR